ncbi:MAG: hypothetical protein FWC58_09050 [Desulfobulbus sp.]|nr:hypothetical protein [Desulfobulbus sp.]
MKRTFIGSLLFSFLLTACVGPSPADTAQREAAQARLTKAEAMFQERCKTAGEFIYRTADNVEGVFLLKLRPKNNFDDQYRMDDPYGRDLEEDGYIQAFLWKRDAKGLFNTIAAGGYGYADAIDPKDGKRYRYTGGMKVVGKQDPTAHNIKLAMERNPNYDLNIYSFRLDKVPAPDPAPRYGVTYDDISTREERDYWIAGSSLKVIDLKTNEVMAERIGYMMDRGQGNKSGGRSPWLFAADHACPRFGPEEVGVPRFFHQLLQTRNFVEKTLHITEEK